MSVRKRGERWMAQVYDPVKGGKVYPGTFDTRAEAKQAEMGWYLVYRGDPESIVEMLRDVLTAAEQHANEQPKRPQG